MPTQMHLDSVGDLAVVCTGLMFCTVALFACFLCEFVSFKRAVSHLEAMDQ